MPLKFKESESKKNRFHNTLRCGARMTVLVQQKVHISAKNRKTIIVVSTSDSFLKSNSIIYEVMKN